MSSILVAHVIAVNLDLGKGMKAILDRVSEKLGIKNIRISQIEDVSKVEEEMNDFGILYSNSLLEKQIKYNCNNSWVTSDNLMEDISTLLFTNSKDALQKEISIDGMDYESYIEMVSQCRSIRQKYIQL